MAGSSGSGVGSKIKRNEAQPQTKEAKPKSLNRQGARDAKVFMVFNPELMLSLATLATSR
jgi:hypothetical protein